MTLPHTKRCGDIHTGQFTPRVGALNIPLDRRENGTKNWSGCDGKGFSFNKQHFIAKMWKRTHANLIPNMLPRYQIPGHELWG